MTIGQIRASSWMDTNVPMQTTNEWHLAIHKRCKVFSILILFHQMAELT